jgi:pimeloyl-ACP methyl ester carboxylesterase
VAHYAPKPGEARARLERALATRTGAVRDAPAAPGRFPVVVYNAGGGQPSWDNFALCQHLASHGFVVVASPSTWSWSRVGGGSDLASAEAAARDLEFHVGWARSQPSVDPGRIALMGFSWGGQAAVMVALRNPAVRAVVSLDGSEGNHETQWEQAPHRDPRQARAAYLGFSSSLERSVQGAVLRGAPPPSQEDLARSGELLAHPRFASGLKYADSYFVVMERFNHGNFASHWAYLEVEDDRRPGEPTAEQEHQDSAALARYVVEFLRGYLRDDGGARRWLARPPAENGIPPGTLRVDFRPASRWPRPAVDEFASLARTRGLDGLQSLVAQARVEDPAYGLTEEDFMTWAHLLGHAHQPVQALGVLRWAAEAWPESAGVRQHLCPALEADRPAQLACWRRLAELAPEDADVKKAIAHLEAK